MAGWPVPAKPQASLDELHIPEDIDSLNPVALANLSIRISGWYSFTSTELAFARAECATFVELFEIRLGKAMYYTAQSMEGRPVKEVVRGITLEDSELARLHTYKLRLETKVITIEGLVTGLAIQCRSLESEQIRRASMRKFEGGQL